MKESAKFKCWSVKLKVNTINATANINKTEDTEERESEKKSATSNRHNKNSEQDVSHEIEHTNASNSPANIENNGIERCHVNDIENVSLQNQEISPEKNIIQSFTERYTGHNTRANNSKRSGSKKDDSMIKLLDGLEMAKRIQSDWKIYVKIFSDATASCVEGYMKPSLRNTGDHFILHFEMKNLSSEKFSVKIAELITNMACRLKNEMYDFSVSTIICRNDDKKLNKKGMEVNSHLKGLIKEKNTFLIDKSRKIKAQYPNKGKLKLTKYGARVLSKR